jgi:hypothetical protein
MLNILWNLIIGTALMCVFIFVLTIMICLIKGLLNVLFGKKEKE